MKNMALCLYMKTRKLFDVCWVRGGIGVIKLALMDCLVPSSVESFKKFSEICNFLKVTEMSKMIMMPSGNIFVGSQGGKLNLRIYQQNFTFNLCRDLTQISK